MPTMTAYDGFYHYLPVNDEAMRWGLYVTGAGRGTIASGETYPPVSHPGLYNFQWSRGRILPEFQLILLTDGEGVFESEPTGVVPLKSGTIVFLFPGVWHRYRPNLDTGWKERWISLNGALAHRLLEINILSAETAARQTQSPKTAAKAFDQLLEQIHRDPLQNSTLLSLDVMALLGSVLKNVTSENELHGASEVGREEGARDPIAAKAIELIWTHSHQVLSVQEIANRLSISRRSLERRFKRVLGHTVLQEIASCRLSRAKRLLRETDLPVKSVAYLAGFPSGERMRVTFIQEENHSPSEYRNRELQHRKPRPGRPRRK